VEYKKVLGCVSTEEYKYKFSARKTEKLPAGTCFPCPDSWETVETISSPTKNYNDYFKWMFFICLLGVITSGLQIIACFVVCCSCLDCFGKISVWTSFVVQIGSIIMLIVGSMWRFSLGGRSCATNVGRAKDDWTEDAISSGLDKIQKETTTRAKAVKAEFNKAMVKAGLADKVDEEGKTVEAYYAHVWGETAYAMKLLLFW